MEKTATTAAPVVETSFRVRYAETDQMGIVYYANYYIWMEVGRNEYCRQCGFSYRELEEQHKAYLVVAESQCRYRAPAKYDDEVVVRTWVTSLHRRTARFAYEIQRSDGTSLAVGETLHVLIDTDGHPVSFPPYYLELLRGERIK
ncbi:MAG TPA: thioesterase family protein [Blastocatellia bacterium]|nr:thioesterase family protein [Blastocatellia bacterium]